MSIKFEAFPSAGGGAGTDTLDDVTGRGSSTTNAITVGGVTIGTEYTLPTADGLSNQYLKTDGAGNLSFAALDITGGLEYKGEYTGQSLVTAEKGDFYIVSGSQTLAGVSLSSGDHIVFNTNATDPVLSTQFDVIDNTETTPTLDAVTTQGSTTTNDVAVGGLTVQGDISADGNLTRSIGDETNRFISYFGDVNGAIRFKAKNDSGAQMTKGQVVTITGVSGTIPTVDLADANDSAKMPAFGLVYANANDQAEVQIVSFGNLENVNTGTFTAGDTLFVSTTAGALTATKPTGESSLLQNIGRVVRSDASAGVIIVGGAGRTAATPNLDQNKVFLGNASNQATPTALSSIALSSFNDDLSYLVPSNNLSDLASASTARTNLGLGTSATLDTGVANGNVIVADATGLPVIDGSQLTNITATDSTKLAIANNLSDLNNVSTARTNLGLGTSATLDVGTTANLVVQLDASARLPAVDGSQLTNLPGGSAASETVAGVIEIATNLEAQGATATDKALVPSNLSDIDLSVLDNTTSAFISDITSESLNDLNDVSFTAGAGIDNYVLTYDHSTTSWGAEVASGGGGYTVSNQGSSDFTASNNTFYYVNTASGTTTTVTLPGRTYAATDERIKFFNHGNGTLRVQETSGTSRIHPDESGNDPGGSGQTYKDIDSRSVIEFLGIPNTYQWEWAISAQLELGKDTLESDGQVLRYNSSSDQMTALPYTFPTSDGSANQILKTDGSGALTFIDQPSGSAPDVVTDSTGTDTTISTYTGTEEIHLISNSTNNVTITIPAASTVGEGYKYQIKRLGTGTVSVTPSSGNIDASTSFSLASQYDSVTLVSDNSNYYII